MLIKQNELQLPAFSRGFHSITAYIQKAFAEWGIQGNGLLKIFIAHTSASLTINEDADPDVKVDFETFFNQAVPEYNTGFIHTLEGPDDMPAHIKASLLGCQVDIPITKGRLHMGTWQGVYLGEHRNEGGRRKIILTYIGEK
jgi:secondary thiamine-phosphate synthase enzyme